MDLKELMLGRPQDHPPAADPPPVTSAAAEPATREIDHEALIAHAQTVVGELEAELEAAKLAVDKAIRDRHFASQK